MKIQIASDLHLEFFKKYDVVLNDVLDTTKEAYKDTILVLAGDVALWETNKMMYKRFLREACGLYYSVILVQGNHEFYHSIISVARHEMKQFSKMINNLYLLDNDIVDIGNYRFIGSTMWTSLNNNDPATVYTAHSRMNDYSYIYSDDEISISTDLVMNYFRLAKYFIIDNLLSANRDNKKSIVVTHTAPSSKSISGKYKSRGDLLSYSYADDLLEKSCFNIGKAGPELWIHGHIHESVDYIMANEKTRVISNPFGYYPSDRNQNYKRLFEVQLDD